MAEESPDRTFAFKYLFDVRSKNITGGFSTVGGISEEIEVVDMRDGTDPFQIRKIRGIRQGGSITLERGIIKNRVGMLTWFGDVKKSIVPYWANVEIHLIEPGGNAENSVLSVRVVNGWPFKYEVQDLDAKTSEMAIEVLSIAHEGLQYRHSTG